MKKVGMKKKVKKNPGLTKMALKGQKINPKNGAAVKPPKKTADSSVWIKGKGKG